MADNKVQIIIETIDKTKGALKNVTGYFDDLKNSFDKISRSPALQFLKDAIDYTDKYALKVRDFSDFTGMSIDETSRLIGAAANFGIEYDTLMKGMENALKNGKNVTVEELGAIADEYVAIGKSDGPVGQAKLLIDNFGQAGLGMGALFAQGAIGVSTAMSDIDESLAIDEGEMTKIQAYQESVGEFNEALGGLKVAIATEAMPALTDFFGMLGDIIGKFDEFDVKWRLFYAKVTTFGTLFTKDRVGGFLGDQSEFAKGMSTYQEYNDFMRESIEIAEQYFDLSVDGYGAVRTKTGEAIDGVIILTEEEWKAQKAAEAIKNEIGAIPNSIKKTIIIDGYITDAGREAISYMGGGGQMLNLGVGVTREEQAYGGVVGGNTPYLVGEKGPEIFVPQTAGKIVPNSQLGGGGSDFDYDRLGRVLVEALERSSLVR